MASRSQSYFGRGHLLHRCRRFQPKDDVAVLGATTTAKLGLGTDAVGATITINDTPLTVIGVLASSGSLGSTNEDDLVLVPITLAQSQFLGFGHGPDHLRGGGVPRGPWCGVHRSHR